MNKKSIEGINQLLFTLGALLGGFLVVKGVNIWVAVIAVLIVSFILDKIVKMIEMKRS